MSKKSITQKSSDNFYLHKDFHVALNFGLEYLRDQFGDEAVEEYLIQFAKSYYALLKKELVKKGLAAIKEHYEKIYKIEDAGFKIDVDEGSVTIYLEASPAVMHIKSGGHAPSPLYIETIRTINKEICAGTPYAFELLNYNKEDGGYVMHFYKKEDV